MKPLISLASRFTEVGEGMLGLSQNAYFEGVLKKYNMHKCSPSPAPIVKSDKFGTFQCPGNQNEIDQMKSVTYALDVESSSMHKFVRALTWLL